MTHNHLPLSRGNQRIRAVIPVPGSLYVDGNFAEERTDGWTDNNCKTKRHKDSIIAWKALGRDCTNNNVLILQIGVLSS